MARTRKPIEINPGVSVTTTGGSVNVTGPKGTLTVSTLLKVKVDVNQNQVIITPNKGAENSSLTGLYTSLIRNAVTGVTQGWSKTLELVGVGYRAQTSGSELTLSLGFAQPVTIKAIPGITFKVEENKITISGVDKYLVGEVAATIRRLKKPEPYKGKGIRYEKEIIRKKLGKAAKAVGGVGAK
jgi:large subunit ribosomal protein L6